MVHLPNHLQALFRLCGLFLALPASENGIHGWGPCIHSRALPPPVVLLARLAWNWKIRRPGLSQQSQYPPTETMNFRTWKVIISSSAGIHSSINSWRLGWSSELYQLQNSEVFMISSCINFRTWRVFMIWRYSEAPLMYQGGTEFIVVFFIYPKPQCAGRWGSQKIIKVNKKTAEEHVRVWRAGVNANGFLLQDIFSRTSKR